MVQQVNLRPSGTKCFQMKPFNGKTFTYQIFSYTTDNKLRNFQYEYLRCIVPTNQILTKFKIACWFSTMRVLQYEDKNCNASLLRMCLRTTVLNDMI